MKRPQALDSSTKYFIAVLGILGTGYLFKEMQSIFIPFTIAYLLYFLFAPINALLKRFRIPSFVGVLLNIVIIIGITYGASSLLVASFSQLSENINTYFEKLNTIIRETAVSVGSQDPDLISFSIQDVIARLDYAGLAGGVISSSLGVMGTTFFMLFFFIFISSGHEAIIAALKKRFIKIRPAKSIMPVKNPADAANTVPESNDTAHDPEQERKVLSTFDAIPRQIQKYVGTKILLNLAAGIVSGLFLWILGVDFPIVWGFLVFFMNFIPTIGSAVAMVLPTLMSLLQFNSFGFTIIIGVSLAGIQTLFFNVLEPMIMGKRLNLNPIVILLSVLIWGYIWGVVGMLLAVPLTAIMKIIISGSQSENLILFFDLMSDSPVEKIKKE